MYNLVFNKDKHLYELNGEIVPSVTELSRFASREVYNNGNIDKSVLENAANRGSLVHSATENLDKFSNVECEEYIEPYIRAYIQFRKDFKIKSYYCIETALASESMLYAGTIDRVYTIDNDFAIEFKKQTKIDISDKIGKLAIIDLKSSSVVQKTLAQIQLNGYKQLVEENKFGDVGVLIILHLNKEKKYKIHNFNLDNTLFMSCYHLHKAFEKKKRKKKENNVNGK